MGKNVRTTYNMKKQLLLLISFILIAKIAFAQTTVSGYLTDSTSGEALLYASIYIEGTTQGVNTNAYGFYSITVPKGESVALVFSYTGYNSYKKTINISNNLTLNVSLNSSATQLNVVEIVAEKSKLKEAVKSTQMSSINIPIDQIKTFPSLGGEVDIIKVMQLLPGVAKGGEGGSSMFVRGGDADQNLVLIDEAIVYNIGHLFGFFSVFNPDAIKDVTMIKGAFPANYGGRLSAVLDIRMKDGNVKTFQGEGGIGLLSSRVTLEGPIIKDKASFLISGRRTYIDQVFKGVGINLPYYFYDLNAKLNYKISDKDRVFFSAYFGNDVLDVSETVEEQDSATGQNFAGAINFGFTLGNFTQTLRWNHIFTPKLFSNLSLIHTRFNYDIKGSFIGNSILIQSSIRDIGLKFDLTQYQNNNLTFKYGANVINHQFRPNIISTSGVISDVLAGSEGALQTTLETAVYGNAEYDLNEKLRVSAGLRISTTFVKDKAYAGLEPRLSARYSLGELTSAKVSYSRMKQYMHRVSSSTVALPTDLWYPVSANIKPQRSDQIALGLSHAFEKINTSVTLEGYYKSLDNLIEYREGTNLILNDNFEEQLLQGKGKAYGTELLVRREEGKFTGWVAYTLSWSKRQFDELNRGKEFWAKYDRRHSLSLVMNYDFNEKYALSAIWEYASGARFTALVGQYFQPNPTFTSVDIIPVYTDRNAVRMSPSHRLDVNFVIRRGTKRKHFQSEWHIGFYNIYNRATPYRINIEYDPANGYQYVQPGLFGRIFNIAWNFKFK